ncbi:hypothetical protein JNUCC0626_04915 [Lentzea sp. JNUCC 0626]|uniref:hypothetical protein n=1 Tax=Lentzea sp. JNUCC 0626 TaxID=3367513 RepID=UPI00374A3A35
MTRVATTPRRVLAGLVGVLTVVSLVTAPQASAAACAYHRVDLPLPAGTTSAWTKGSSPNNSRIVAGYLWDGHQPNGLLWINGSLRIMPEAVRPLREVYPEAVNNSGVVVGRQENRYPNWVQTHAFRYEGFGYSFLYTTLDENSDGLFVNEAGDVLGTVWDRDNPGDTTVVLWPRAGGRLSFGPGRPLGLSGRKIVKRDETGKVLIVDADNGASVEVPDAAGDLVVDNERLLGVERGGQLTEWNLNGVKVNAHPGGEKAFGRNNSGTVFGTVAPQSGGGLALWRPSGRTSVVADELPHPQYYGDVSDAATLFSSWQDETGNPYPARWLWICG